MIAAYIDKGSGSNKRELTPLSMLQILAILISERAKRCNSVAFLTICWYK